MAYDGPIPLKVPSGNTGTATFTAYTPICAGTTATGAFQNVASVGTSGQVLTSAGAGALPTFSGSGNNLVLIQSQAASNSVSIVFSTGITSTYNSYLLVCSNVIPVTNNVTIAHQWSTDGGSTFIQSGYTSGSAFGGYTTAGLTGNVNTTSFNILFANLANTAATGNAGVFDLLQVTSATYPTASGFWERADGLIALNGCIYPVAITANAFRILTTSGNISSGTFSLFGVLP